MIILILQLKCLMIRHEFKGWILPSLYKLLNDDKFCDKMLRVLMMQALGNFFNH